MEGTIKTKIEGKTGLITFFHPASNSFPSHLLLQLEQEINKLADNKKLTLIALQSEGNKAFCAGASFDELLSITNKEDGKKFFSGFANVINALRKAPQITVAKVQGKAVGGGVGLLAACDYVIATEAAAIKLSEIAIGIGPFVIEPAVSKKIGTNAMSTLTLNPTNWQTANWAKEKGLYQEVYTTLDEANEAFNSYINKTSLYNPLALVEIKKIIWGNCENWDSLLSERAAISGELVLSDFTKNALDAFRKKD